MNEKEPHQTVLTRTYKHEGCVYVPHYMYLVNRLFVGPCGNTYTEAFLRDNAQLEAMMLWPREGTQV